MHRSKLVLGLLALAVVALSVPALAGAAKTTQLSAKLKGNEEVSGGDTNGKGEAFVAVKPKKGKICFQVEFARIENPTAAHIHRGVKGQDGPIKVTLFTDPAGLPGPTAEGCAKGVKTKLARRIAKGPEKFYVNLHNKEFPDGAIRGQLAPAL